MAAPPIPVQPVNAPMLRDRYVDTPWRQFFDLLLAEATGGGSAITSLTGDVVATGPGAAVATIANLAVTTGKIANLAVTTGKIADDAVTFAKMQNIATQRAIGRNTTGTGDPEEVTISQMLDWTA